MNTIMIGGREFAWGRRTYLMAVLNITPDSFSGDGLAQGEDVVAAALAQARRAADEGADILDVGGESTRPGAVPVTLEEEQRRVLPVIQALRHELALPISVDTYRAETAALALDAGAQLVNDVWGLRTPEGGWNSALATLVAGRGVPIVVMHNRRAQAVRGRIGGHYPDVQYTDLLGEIGADLRAAVSFAEAHGVQRAQIIVDPGVGFGKSPAQNMELIRRLAELRVLELPVLVGASRKSFIGQILDLPPEERDEGTAAVTALAIERGADIVRVHHVQINARVARVVDALVRPSGTLMT